MLEGTLLAESLRVGQDLRVADLRLTRIGRHDVSQSTVQSADTAEGSGGFGSTEAQPGIWTFVEFEAPDERAGELADALAGALIAELGWYADFTVADERVVVFAGKVFRYQVGDEAARREAVEYGLAVGTPPHQLDWDGTIPGRIACVPAHATVSNVLEQEPELLLVIRRDRLPGASAGRHPRSR